MTQSYNDWTRFNAPYSCHVLNANPVLFEFPEQFKTNKICTKSLLRLFSNQNFIRYFQRPLTCKSEIVSIHFKEFNCIQQSCSPCAELIVRRKCLYVDIRPPFSFALSLTESKLSKKELMKDHFSGYLQSLQLVRGGISLSGSLESSATNKRLVYLHQGQVQMSEH